MIRRKETALRIFIDYRMPNEITPKNPILLSSIGVNSDGLHGSKWFLVMNLACGNWRVEVKTSDVEKSGFRCILCKLHVRNNSIMFIGPYSNLQKIDGGIFKGMFFDKCLVYLDDMIIHRKVGKEKQD